MNLGEIPFDDKPTFALLSSGETEGIFQVNSYLGKKICKDVRPQSLDDVAAVMALSRPGSLDNGSDREFAQRKRSGNHRPSIHPDLDDDLAPILASTYGVLIYQEQVMEIIAKVAGWDYGEADDLFSALRKKKLEKMEASRPAFFAASLARGYSPEGIQALWGVLVPFSDYSFGRAHSVGYAYLTYRGAYLKCHYPREYMAALLSTATDPKKLDRYVAETKRLQIPVLPPDVNQSGVGFTPTKEGIRYGLRAIKGVGDSATEALLERRPYGTIDDFFRRADPLVLNSGVFSALVKSGAFDSVWPSRSELLEQGPEIAAVALTHRKQREQAQQTILRVRYRPKKVAGQVEEGADVRRGFELEVLGTQLTWPKALLRLSRPLTAVEWKHIKDSLGLEAPEQKVDAILGGARFSLPIKTAVTAGLARALAAVGVRVESE